MGSTESSPHRSRAGRLLFRSTLQRDFGLRHFGVLRGAVGLQHGVGLAEQIEVAGQVYDKESAAKIASRSGLRCVLNDALRLFALVAVKTHGIHRLSSLWLLSVVWHEES